MIITRTPFRLSLFGGGTDYPAWYLKNGGLVIATSMAYYCYISCRFLTPFFDYKTRVVYSEIEAVKEHKDIRHPAARACLEFLEMEKGIEIHHDGDLPARTGIGSSSSFTVGLLAALHGLRHEMLTKERLAEEAIHIEQRVLNENVGIQDQILAAYGGLRVIEMGPGPDYCVTPLILAPDYLRELQDHILLGFTGITRVASTIASKYIKVMEKKDDRFDEMHSITREALGTLRQNRDLERIGRLLHRSWMLKRSLAGDVTRPEIDALYEAGRRAGAYGGKLLGAGGGGFMMFLAPPECHERIWAALPQIKTWVPFRMDNQGSQIVFYHDGYSYGQDGKPLREIAQGVTHEESERTL
ncbi:MAG: kinase [Candidatus Omnitrophica bacterium]|nr:kinase [Candidatus Omnitrophota bacterium]